jgi:hypothetical protein
MRTLLNILISLKLNNIIPLDKNLAFHRLVAKVIVLATALHAFELFFFKTFLKEVHIIFPTVVVHGFMIL